MLPTLLVAKLGMKASVVSRSSPQLPPKDTKCATTVADELKEKKTHNFFVTTADLYDFPKDCFFDPLLCVEK